MAALWLKKGFVIKYAKKVKALGSALERGYDATWISCGKGS